MQRNTMAAGIGGAVIALAVAGIGLLVFKGKSKPAPPAEVPAPAQPTSTQKPPALKAPTVRRLPRGETPSAQPVRQHTPVDLGSTNLAKVIAEVLRDYDEIVLNSTGVEGQSPILSLKERRDRLDALLAKLVELGPDAVPLLLEAVRQDALANRIDRETFVVRAIAKIPGKAAMDALAELLRESQAWGVKMAVVSGLAERGGEGLALLRTAIAEEQDYRVRGAIVKQLGSSTDEATLEVIATLARSDPNPNVRRAAIRALQGSKDPMALRTLEDLARVADDVSVQQAAIQAYAAAAGPQGVILLEELIIREQNIRVKAVAVLGLQVVGTDEAVAALERVANDVNQTEDVRARARGALAAVERTRSGGVERPPLRERLQPIMGEGLRPLESEADRPDHE